ncbi:MAG: CHY zinc finger protein [Pseudomonadales bacterium]
MDVDPQTRCGHYHTDLDVVAIRFYCCGNWYACHDCHVALADHPSGVWPQEHWAEEAVLCGVCGYRLSVHQYLTGDSNCPSCSGPFNPGCRLHHYLYFESRQ